MLIYAEKKQPDVRMRKTFHFVCYDAWQMFKHMLGIYNQTSKYTQKGFDERLHNKNIADVSLINKFNKVTLVNVVFEPSYNIISDKNKKNYIKRITAEQRDFETFKQIVEASGITEIFAEDCGFTFEIKYINVAEFIDLFEKTKEEMNYLQRYIL